MVIDVGQVARSGHQRFLLKGCFVAWMLIACSALSIGKPEVYSELSSNSWEAMQLQAKHNPLCSLLYQTPACAAVTHRKSAVASRPGPACGVETCLISNAHAPSFTAPSMRAARRVVRARAQIATGVATGIASAVQHELNICWAVSDVHLGLLE